MALCHWVIDSHRFLTTTMFQNIGYWSLSDVVPQLRRTETWTISLVSSVTVRSY